MSYEDEEEPLTVDEILTEYRNRELHIEKDKDHNFWIDGRRRSIGGRFVVSKKQK